MAENALRNLQIFRNGAVITNKTASEIRTMVDSALVAGTLVLHDGEPISIRYEEGGNIKGLIGVAYIKGQTKQVLWSGNDIVIETSSEPNAFIALTHTEDPEGHYTLSVEYTTVKLEEATATNDGLATALDVKEYIDNLPHKTYQIAKKETAEDGYLSTYYLEDETGAQVGVSINIPKDFLVKGGKIATVETANVPYEGAVVGDKYIDFVINVKEGTATEEHIYIPVNDLVDVYTPGNGIELSKTNAISVKYSNENHNVTFAFDGNGALVADYTETSYNGADGISLTENAETGKTDIAVDLSTETGNILQFKDGKLFAQLGASTAISDIQVIDNTSSASKYYTVDVNGKIVEDTTTEHTGAFEVQANTKMLLVATEDKKINGAVLPDTEDTYVTSGELVEIAATETEEAQTVIRLSYNTSKEPIDIDVTDLVNTAHTVVKGENHTLNNSNYVNVRAITDTTTNIVTLSSSVRTASIGTATDMETGWVHGIDFGLQNEPVALYTTAFCKECYNDEYWASIPGEEVTISCYHIERDTNQICIKQNVAKYVTEDNIDKAVEGMVSDNLLISVSNNVTDGLATVLDVRNYVDSHETIVTSSDNSVNVEESVNENGAHVYDVTVDIPEVSEAVVERNLGNDGLNVTTTGTLNQDAMAVIENYIDNYDCGTFELAVNEMAGALNNELTNAGNGEINATNVNDNISVANNEGTINISNN